jgi:hypothetical protein
MFLDALCDDAAWLAKYAKDRDGKVMPFDLVELAIRNKHPYKVYTLYTVHYTGYTVQRRRPESVVYGASHRAVQPGGTGLRRPYI